MPGSGARCTAAPLRYHSSMRFPVLAAVVVALAAPGPACPDEKPPAAAAAPEPPPPAEPPPAQAEDPQPTPPGSKEDQALWKSAGDVSNEVVAARWRANGLQWRIKTEDLVNRLNAAARAEPGAEARLLALRERMVNAQADNLEVYRARWPVDTTRVCQYPQLDLASAMHASDPVLLGEARVAASRCVGLARGAVDRLEATTRALAAAIADVEAAIPPLPAQKAAAPAPPPPGGK